MFCSCPGVDLADFWGTHGERRRWVGAEWSGAWGRVSPPNRLKGLVERRELPRQGPGRILADFEGHRTLLFVPT